MRMKMWIENLVGTIKLTTEDYAGPTQEWTFVGYVHNPLYDEEGNEQRGV